MAEVKLTPRAAAARQLHNRHMTEADFDQAPFTIAWEVARACAFACAHCRADAQHTRDPNELTTEEGFRLLDRVREFGSPIVVFTGGDPMMRRDLFDLIGQATALGLRASLTPTATALPTPDRRRQAMARRAAPATTEMSAAGSAGGPTPLRVIISNLIRPVFTCPTRGPDA